MTDPKDQKPKPTTCVVIQPDIVTRKHQTGDYYNHLTPDEQLEEAVALAKAIKLTVVDHRIIKIKQPHPATLLRGGAVEELGQQIKYHKIGLAVINGTLSTIQQRNLEQTWKCKVIDRTGLILEIFGARAKSKAGQLQVELAALSYQKTRLVRAWTHLERQRGGFGFVGGPGERQIELDRRMIQTRVDKIKRELKKLNETRKQNRKSRQRGGVITISLVGYTNAGKSTLFNELTQSKVLAKDMLFATLDPTVRKIDMPSKHQVVLSDTVGFIADLPTQLIEAFKSTLEEIFYADVILHVRDISTPYTDQQKLDVEHVLNEMGIEELDPKPKIIEVWNKIDLLSDQDRKAALNTAARDKNILAVSAIEKESCKAFLKALDKVIDDS